MTTLVPTAQSRAAAPASQRAACACPAARALPRRACFGAGPARRAQSRLRLWAEEGDGSGSGSGSCVEGSAVQPQELARTVRVTLKRPLGLVLAENEARDAVFVDEIVPGGNAATSGEIRTGDVVSEVSATVLKAGKEGQFEKEGYGQRPYDNWETIMFDCKGQSFDTVMSAIDSNNPRWGINTVTLVLKRKQGE